MRRDLLIVFAVLLASSGVAVAANVVWHKLPWMRPPKPEVENRNVEASKRRNAETPKVDKRSVPPLVDAQDEQVLGPGEVGIAFVVEHLANRTAHFIDARGTDDYAEGHLAGALTLPSNAVYKNIDAILSLVPSVETVIVYCGGGECEASHTVADVLRDEFGYTNVLVYKYGWEEVESSGRFEQWIITGAEP